MSLTKRMSAENKRVQARKACIYAFSILTAFLLLGNGIISLFSISMPYSRRWRADHHDLGVADDFLGEDSSSEVDAEPADIKKLIWIILSHHSQCRALLGRALLRLL